jgi:UDP-N-acetylmuramate--alanine ligase
MFRHIKHVYFVGIGGIGMSGIAELLINSGYKISGSDIHLSPITVRLEELGARISEGHHPKNIGHADLIVYSSAIKPSNPELREARKRKIPCIPRAEILGELMRMQEGIAITGTHGKTTTTSMVGKILETANFDPTIIVGGKLRSLGTNAKLGQGKFIVCEADESDKLFLKWSPVITVITSIDEDHLDRYKNIEEIRETFLKFANRVPFYGCNIVCNDELNITHIIPRMKKRCITYGFSEESNVRIKRSEPGNPSHFWLQTNGDDLGEFVLSLPGTHNILNACAAIAVGIELEIPLHIIKQAVLEFKGTHRRFELKGEIRGIKIMDDYAHHPREIEVTLRTARSFFSGRIIVIFQPHLFSRTQKLCNRFANSFWDADQVFITPIYPARESPIPGVAGKLIVESALSAGYKKISYVESKEELVNWCLTNLKPGDTLFTIGAGDIHKVGEELLALLSGEVENVEI